ncbi:MAG: polynucleotide adenylyltransferase [Helicobacteraceae bacterium CG2_30_36_10]|nr:MAG: polynucleotide adenylyltransferase [Helicobacteraceae bacterium CG2_30_36_10]
MIDYPNKLNKIFDKLQKNGALAVIIGGYIRDKILKIDSKDIDIEVYGVSSFSKLESILEEFGSVNSVGKSFGVCKLHTQDLKLDFTLPRIESKTTSGHTGFDINIKSDLDFISATRRRDFTMNAIGYDVVNKKILDPFNGIEDLKNKILKSVDAKSFIEDPLRVYRAVQFCARFNLKMHSQLFNLCTKMIKENMLSELSKERVFQEIKKLLLKSEKPSLGYKLFKKLGITKEFDELHFLVQNSWNQVLNTIDNLAQNRTSSEITNIVLMLAGICYKLDVVKTKSFIIKLSDEKELSKRVLSLISNPITTVLSDSKLYKLATKVNIEELLILNRAVFKGTNNQLYKTCDAIQIRAKNLGVLNKKMPPFLRGRDILACGISPSKEFSTILEKAYEVQMNGEFHSHEEATAWLRKYLAP